MKLSSSQRIFAFLFCVLLNFSMTTTGYGMLRVFKFRDRTEVHQSEICVVTSHEHNPKRANIGAKTNTSEPIVCRLEVTSGVADRVTQAPLRLEKSGAVVEFAFGQEVKTCLPFPSLAVAKEKLTGVERLTSMCVPKSAAQRVFPEFLSNGKAKTKISIKSITKAS